MCDQTSGDPARSESMMALVMPKLRVQDVKLVIGDLQKNKRDGWL
jgi:hypothetical protein